MTNLTRIVAAIVDTKKATFYKEDGTTIVILQGDVRLRPLLEQITPLLASQRYADVDLSPTDNSYKDFEEKTNGAVRFFRIAKSKLASIFGAKKEEPVQPVGYLGELPKEKATAALATAVRRAEAAAAAKNMAAVNEIIKNAVPVTSSDFDEAKVAVQRPTAVDGQTPSDKAEDGIDPHFNKHEETIVAITPKGNVVSGVERIKSQVTAASGESANPVGLTRFLERVGTVAGQRKHTADDLLRFMERGDLPIADDGSIIIYKRLQRQGDVYVDCHSHKVTQKVGSYVHMDISLVDHNRRNECSNGLHVARRGYIRSFNGNVCVLAKVRPEDVIAVPDYDANKMRVCGYHIIAELTPEQFHAVEKNMGIDNAPGGAELLANAMTGNHIGITQRVKINGSMGTKLEITDIVPADQQVKVAPVEIVTDLTVAPEKPAEVTAPADKEETEPAKKKVVKSKKAKKAQRKVAAKAAVKQVAVQKAKSIDAASAIRSDNAVDPKQLQKLKEGTASTLSGEVKGPTTQTSLVKAMWDAALSGEEGKAKALLDFKKAAKKGWTVWGLPANAGDTLKALL